MRIQRTHNSGLILAEDAADERSIGAAITRMTDGRFSLQKERRDGAPGGWVFRVVHVESGSEAFVWADQRLRPLPLSSGLLDEFQRHLVGARNAGLGADEHNQQLVERRNRQLAADLSALVEEHRPQVDRGRVAVSLGAARKVPYWQRKFRGGYA